MKITSSFRLTPTAVRASDESDDSANKRRRVVGEFSPAIPDQAVSMPLVVAATAAGSATPRARNAETNASNISIGGGSQQNRLTNTTNIGHQEGFPQLLLETLQSENGETVANGFVALASKIRDVTSAQELSEFFVLGGHATVSLLMRKSWPDAIINQTIQTMGCCCIASMIQGGLMKVKKQRGFGRTGAGNQELVSDNQIFSPCIASCRLLGTMGLVIKALKDYPESKDLQKFGIAALLNLLLVPFKTTDNENNIAEGSQPNQDAKLLAEELCGVHIVSKAMTRFPMEEKIQALGISVLRLLCRLGMKKAPVMKTKALVAVAQAVQNFPENENMAKVSLSFMNAILGPPSSS